MSTPNDRLHLATLEDNGNLTAKLPKFATLTLADIRRRRRQEEEVAAAGERQKRQRDVDHESEINYKRMRLNAAMAVVVETGTFQVLHFFTILNEQFFTSVLIVS